MGDRKGRIGVGKRWSKTAQASSFRVGRKLMDSTYNWKKKKLSRNGISSTLFRALRHLNVGTSRYGGGDGLIFAYRTL